MNSTPPLLPKSYKPKQATQYFMRTKGSKKYLHIGDYSVISFKDSPLGAWHTNKQLAQSIVKGECSIFPNLKPSEPLELVKVSAIPKVLFK